MIAPEIKFERQGEYSFQNKIADGSFSLNASDLSEYAGLFGADVSGKILSNGHFNISGNEINIDLAAKANSIRFGELAIDKLNFSLKNQTPETLGFKVDGNGAYIKPFSINGSGNISGISTGSATFLPAAEDVNFAIKYGESSLSMDGNISQKLINFQTKIHELWARDIPVALPEQISKDAKLSGEIFMTGLLDKPATTGKINVTNIASGVYKIILLSIEAQHRANMAQLKISGKGSGIDRANADISIPISFSFYPFLLNINEAKPLSGNVKVQLNTTVLSSSFLPAYQTLNGKLYVDAKLSGGIGNPDIMADVNFKNGVFADVKDGLEIINIQSSTKVTRERFVLEKLSASDGEKGIL